MKLSLKKEIWGERISRRIINPLSQINFNGLLLQDKSQLYNSNLRYCLIKQEVCSDLYCCPPSNNPQEIIFSSLLRTGMVGLFTKLNADFYIVKIEKDIECQIWKEQAINSDRLKHFYDLKNKIDPKNIANNTHPPGYYAISAYDINWDLYDVIISVNISIPNSIVKMHPNKLWCYYIQEPNMKSYRLSMEKPIKNYDLFLNQRFDYLCGLRNKKKHVVDFPYYLQYYGCFQELLKTKEYSVTKKNGIFICKHSLRKLSPTQIKKIENLGHTIYEQSGSPKEMISNLLKSKYYIKVGGDIKRWGNAIIESIASGNLFIGNPLDFYNKSLFTKRTKVKSIEEAINKINYFDNDTNLYNDELNRQIKLANWLCFNRPVKRIEREFYKKQR